MRNTIMTLPIRTLRALLVPFLVLSTAWAAPTFHVLHAFSGGATDGSNPNSRLTLDRLGDLFGEAFSGGSTGCSGNGCGVAFELSFKNGHWRDSNFYSFSSLNGGFPNPEFAVALDAAGNVYGTEYSGGDPACNCGSIFQLTRIGGVWTLNTLHTFTGQPSDGAYPSSGLFRDASGNLFGSTFQGGVANSGTIFELTPGAGGTWTYNQIYQFGSSTNTDGSSPYGPLTIDSAGNIYGTTQAGGLYNDGAVYRVSPSNGAWTDSLLYNFTLDFGQSPEPYGVVLAPNGHLYGVIRIRQRVQVHGSEWNCAGNRLALIHEWKRWLASGVERECGQAGQSIRHNQQRWCQWPRCGFRSNTLRPASTNATRLAVISS